jgi:4'-phosphopantetheinyl transferase
MKQVFNPKNQGLSLGENEVHIWNIDLDKINKQKKLFKKILSNDELIRANKFHFEVDEERFISGKGLLRLLISAYTGISPNIISFTFNNFGKPELSKEQNNYNLNFNMSHSKNMLCLAFVKNQTIGIDIEVMKPINDHLEIANRYFSNSEIEQLNSFSDDKVLEGFYTCWTSKEAVIKLLGEGLSFPLKDFDVRLKSINIDQTYRYQLRVKNRDEIFFVEVFRTQMNLFGACAINMESFKTIYWFFEEDTYSINNFLVDYLLR